MSVPSMLGWGWWEEDSWTGTCPSDYWKNLTYSWEVVDGIELTREDMTLSSRKVTMSFSKCRRQKVWWDLGRKANLTWDSLDLSRSWGELVTSLMNWLYPQTYHICTTFSMYPCCESTCMIFLTSLSMSRFKFVRTFHIKNNHWCFLTIRNKCYGIRLSLMWKSYDTIISKRRPHGKERMSGELSTQICFITKVRILNSGIGFL